MKTNKKKISKLIIIIFLIFFGLIGGLVESEKQKVSNSNSSKNELNKKVENKIEANTNAMVDKLINDAKKDYVNISTDELTVAINYIKEHIDNLFENNEIMENVIYYGSLLEYYYAIDNDPFKGFSSIEGEIGMNAVQAVKYVYRNVESPEDEATIKNINQIKENIEKLQ